MKKVNSVVELNTIILKSKTTESCLTDLIEEKHLAKEFQLPQYSYNPEKVHPLVEQYSGKDSDYGLIQFAKMIKESGYDDTKPIIIYEDKLIGGRHRLFGFIVATLLDEFGRYNDIPEDMALEVLNSEYIPTKIIKKEEYEIPDDVLINWILQEDFNKVISPVDKALIAYDLVNNLGFKTKTAIVKAKTSAKTFERVKKIIDVYDKRYLLEAIRRPNSTVTMTVKFLNDNREIVEYDNDKVSSITKILEILVNNEKIDSGNYDKDSTKSKKELIKQLSETEETNKRLKKDLDEKTEMLNEQNEKLKKAEENCTAKIKEAITNVERKFREEIDQLKEIIKNSQK